MRILITGSEGFIGSHVVEKFIKEGNNVNCFVQYNSFGNIGWLDHLDIKIKKKIKIYFGDLRDLETIKYSAKNCDAVVHLASLIGIPYSYVAAKSYIQTNVIGTMNILQTCLDLKIKKLIHTSTSEVYGTAQYTPMDENHPIVGQSPYSATKIAADNLALSYYYSFNLPVTILRPFNTFGPRQSLRAVIPSIISQIINNKKEIKLGSTTPSRDFNYVEDIANAYYLALLNDKSVGEIINIGSGFEITIKELIKEISILMNKQISVSIDNKRKRPSKSEVYQLIANNKKAKKILNWQPKYTGKKGLLLGLKKTIKWYEKNNNINLNKTSIYNI